LQAGFAETDITPPPGTAKIGWLKDFSAGTIADPLFARAAVFEAGGERAAVVQLDTLSIRWTQVADIRRRIESACGFPGARIMVAATHNHAGPAVASVGDVRRDEAYIEFMVQSIVWAFQAAWEGRQPAELGFGTADEWRIAYNRRVVLENGTVATHGSFLNNKQALRLEGPIDPEVAVIAARDARGALLGCLVNFACHPTHLGGEPVFSAGYPGVLAATMKAAGCPVTLFLNGACGNVHHADPVSGANLGMREIGEFLAADAQAIIREMNFTSRVCLGGKSTTIELPFRDATADEVRGTVPGAQRFIDPAIYDRGMPALLAKIKKMGKQKAEVQALRLGEAALVGIPAEYFVEHGLRIKEETDPHTLVVSHANGMVGYVPTREAFRRGGYETTFTGSSRLAPAAGDFLADAAIRLIEQMWHDSKSGYNVFY
jgi:hypothetical protein